MFVNSESLFRVFVIRALQAVQLANILVQENTLNTFPVIRYFDTDLFNQIKKSLRRVGFVYKLKKSISFATLESISSIGF